MIPLTIIIPTKNRSEYLENLLLYYSNININCYILILDSSTINFRKKNKKILKNFTNLKIRYKFIIGKSHEVVKKSINLVKTKYCSLCGDDDYLYPKNFKKFVNFLEKNNSYAGVNGTSYLLRKYKETFTFTNYPLTNIHLKKAYLRCHKHIVEYSNPHYSICRTSVFSKAIKLVNKSKYPHDIFNDEFVLNFSLVCFGKFKTKKMTYLFRLIGHARNNLNKNKNQNKINISIKNNIIDLKKIIQKIDNKIYPKFEQDFYPIIKKKCATNKFRPSYIKLFLLKYDFKKSKLYYYLKSNLKFLNNNYTNKNLTFLNKNQIMKNNSFSKDIREFIKFFSYKEKI